MGCEFTWHHLSAIHPGAVGHFLSTRPTTINTPPRSVTTAWRCGWVRYIGRATILRCEAATTTPPPPPALCGLALWLCAACWSGSDPEAIIGHGFRKTRSNKSVVQNLPTRLGSSQILLVFERFSRPSILIRVFSVISHSCTKTS